MCCFELTVPSSDPLIPVNLRMDFSVSNSISKWEGFVAKHKLSQLPLACYIRIQVYSFQFLNNQLLFSVSENIVILGLVKQVPQVFLAC